MNAFARTFVLGLACAALAASAPSADAGVLGWYTTLSGNKVVPPLQTSYAGIGYFGRSGNVLTCHLYCTVNFGTARIHAGAPGTNGPVLGTLPLDSVGEWLGKITLDATNLANLESGNLYAEITGLLVPDKVRGQITMTYALDGTGCPDSIGVPSLGSVGIPTPGSTIYMNSTGAPQNATGLLFVSPLSADLSMGGGCSLLVDPALALVLPLAYGPTGAWGSGGILLPPMPVAQLPLYLQAFVADPAAPNGQFGASARLTINLSTYPL